MATTGEHGARTVVAVFMNRDDARDAARELHDAGYKHTWIGTTRPHGPSDESRGVEPGTVTGTMEGTDIVQGGSPNILGAIGRFFAGEQYTLNEALREHGVSTADAGQLEESIAPGSSVLTVALSDDDVRAGSQDPPTIIARCSGRLLTADSGLTSGEQQLDRDEVRQRRLAATQDVPATQERADVPTIQEEFFTERRRVQR
jgi:hypothetical protein